MSSFQKCCICDGKLMNGRCVDCGMRMSHESRDANLNVDSQKKESIKQHTDAAGKVDKYGYKKWTTSQRQGPAKGFNPYAENSQQNKGDIKKVLGIIKIVIIVAVLMSILYEAVEEYRFQTHEEVVDLGEWFGEDSEAEEEWNPYVK